MAVAGEAEQRLESARAVLAIWSRNARNSTWVHAESLIAADACKLLQMRLDGTPPPPPFNALPIADMSGERGEWGPLEDMLARLVRQGEAPPRPAVKFGLLTTPAAAGTPKLLAIAAGAALAAYAGAMSAAIDGVMSPDQLQIVLTGIIGVAGLSAMLTAYRVFAIARAGG